MRKAINAVIIKDRKILVVRKNETWILPGGKPEPGEKDLTCLCREVDEELGTSLKNIQYHGSFEGITPHKGDSLQAEVYFAELNGPLGKIRKGDTIGERLWTDKPEIYNLSDITSKIISSLRQDNYL